jgi:hypothetical protein
MNDNLDARDQEILEKRIELLNDKKGIRVGDYIRFADGELRRVSYIWRYDDADQSIQTSKGGSYYLGDGFVSMSGSLFTGIKPDTLTPTTELMAGSVWFFHHNLAGAGRGKNAYINFRVYECSLLSTATH